MLTNIDHIGIAVRSLDVAIKFYETALGLKCERQEEVASQKVKIAYFSIGGTHLELLEPSSPDSPIAKFLESRGEGIHHIAFATDGILAQLEQAAQSGCKLIHETPFKGGSDKWVAFLHPKTTHGVLTEICSGETLNELLKDSS